MIQILNSQSSHTIYLCNLKSRAHNYDSQFQETGTPASAIMLNRNGCKEDSKRRGMQCKTKTVKSRTAHTIG